MTGLITLRFHMGSWGPHMGSRKEPGVVRGSPELPWNTGPEMVLQVLEKDHPGFSRGHLQARVRVSLSAQAPHTGPAWGRRRQQQTFVTQQSSDEHSR